MRIEEKVVAPQLIFFTNLLSISMMLGKSTILTSNLEREMLFFAQFEFLCFFKLRKIERAITI